MFSDLIDTFPERGTAVRIGYQLAASATSVAANYRATCRSRSDSEFAAKVGLVLEDADESLFWLAICEERTLGDAQARRQLLREADELTAIFVSSSIKARERVARSRAAKNLPHQTGSVSEGSAI